MNRKHNVLFVTRAAAIAALYCALTAISAGLGLSSGFVQFRFSEALCVLPIFAPEAVYGLTIGCLLSNIITGSALWDVVFGTAATLLGALGTRLLRKNTYLAALSPIAANTLIIPFLLVKVYGIDQALWLCALTVFAGEFVCAGFGGVLLAKGLKPFENKLFH